MNKSAKIELAIQGLHKLSFDTNLSLKELSKLANLLSDTN